MPGECTTGFTGSTPQFCVSMCGMLVFIFMCVEAEIDAGCLLQVSIFFFFEMGMSWILEWTNLARIAHQRPFCYCPLSVRIMRMCHHVWHVYVGARDGSKLGSSLLRTIPLLIQPSFHQNIFRVVKSCSTKLSLKVSCKFGSKNLLPPTSVDSCPNYSCLMTTPYSSLIEGRNGQLLLEVPCDVVQSLPIFRRFLLYV